MVDEPLSELDLYIATGNAEANTLYEAETLQRLAAGQVHVVAKAIFTLLPKTRVSHIATSCRVVRFELKYLSSSSWHREFIEATVVLMAKTVL